MGHPSAIIEEEGPSLHHPQWNQSYEHKKPIVLHKIPEIEQVNLSQSKANYRYAQEREGARTSLAQTSKHKMNLKIRQSIEIPRGGRSISSLLEPST